MGLDKVIKRGKRVCLSELNLSMDFSEEATTYVELYLRLAITLLAHLNLKVFSLRKEYTNRCNIYMQISPRGKLSSEI